jgi:hypothetical protein
VFGGEQTRKGAALRVAIAQEGKRAFEAPSSENKGGESPEISLMNTAAQTARFAAETKSNPQRLAELVLGGDLSANAVAKAMDIPDFPTGGGVTGGAPYTSSNPLPVTMINNPSDRQAEDIPVPAKGTKGAKGVEGGTGPIGPKPAGAETKGAEEALGLSDMTELEIMTAEMSSVEVTGLDTRSAAMSSVDGTTRKIEANSDRTPSAVSDVQFVRHATAVTAERQARGPEAGGGKSREKNEVTLAAGQSPIPVVVVSASGALAAPLTS